MDSISVLPNTSAEVTSSGVSGGTACVVDLDNLLHRGFEKRTGAARPQAQLDVRAFAAALKQRGVTIGTICRNRSFTALAEQTWAALGFTAIAAGKNCDPHVELAVENYAQAGCRDLVLVAGDGDYCGIVRRLQAQGIRVEVWSRKASASTELINTADQVRYIDTFLLPPSAANGNDRQDVNLAAIEPSIRGSKHRLRAPQLGIGRIGAPNGDFASRAQVTSSTFVEVAVVANGPGRFVVRKVGHTQLGRSRWIAICFSQGEALERATELIAGHVGAPDTRARHTEPNNQEAEVGVNAVNALNVHEVCDRTYAGRTEEQ
jgi:hypothetical protein